MSHEQYNGFEYSDRTYFPPARVLGCAETAGEPVFAMRSAARQLFAATQVIANLLENKIDSDDAAEAVDALLVSAGRSLEGAIEQLESGAWGKGEKEVELCELRFHAEDREALKAMVDERKYMRNPTVTVVHAALRLLCRQGDAQAVITEYCEDGRRLSRDGGGGLGGRWLMFAKSPAHEKATPAVDAAQSRKPSEKAIGNGEYSLRARLEQVTSDPHERAWREQIIGPICDELAACSRFTLMGLSTELLKALPRMRVRADKVRTKAARAAERKLERRKPKTAKRRAANRVA